MEAETQYLTIETQACTITWCSINISPFLLHDCQMRALHESSMEEIKGQESNHEGRRQAPGRFGVYSYLFHAKKTPEAKGGSLNKQKNVVFRNRVILELNIKYPHCPGEEAKVKIILYVLKSIFMHKSFTIKHGWLDKLRIKKWLLCFPSPISKYFLSFSLKWG